MSAFWRGRKVLLTGHTGFKGSWLAAWLHRLGASVTGLSLAPTSTPNLYGGMAGDELMQSTIGDVRKLDDVARATQEGRPDIIFHLAAQSLVRVAHAAPVETYTTNVLGTVNVLEAARQSGGVKAIVVVTTDKCYADRDWPWPYRETDRLGGAEPYSSSKACAELVVEGYRRSLLSGIAVATARAGNVIGGGDWAVDRLVPDIMRAVLGGQPAAIRNPGAVRPWQHVLDCLHGYLILAERLMTTNGYDQAWNFGPDPTGEKTVEDVAHQLIELIGRGSVKALETSSTIRETHALRLDSSKARQCLGWSPHLDLNSALQLTARWYRDHESGQSARMLVERDIAAYESLCDCGT